MLDETLEARSSWGTKLGELRADTGMTVMSSSRLDTLEQGTLPSLSRQRLYSEECVPVCTLRLVIYRHILSMIRMGFFWGCWGFEGSGQGGGWVARVCRSSV
jgi:hypothetical protein